MLRTPSRRLKKGEQPDEEEALETRFAGGDVAHGPRTAVEAIRSGKIAAHAIDAWLRLGKIMDQRARPVVDVAAFYPDTAIKLDDELVAGELPYRHASVQTERLDRKVPDRVHRTAAPAVTEQRPGTRAGDQGQLRTSYLALPHEFLHWLVLRTLLAESHTCDFISSLYRRDAGRRRSGGPRGPLGARKANELDRSCFVPAAGDLLKAHGRLQNPLPLRRLLVFS